MDIQLRSAAIFALAEAKERFIASRMLLERAFMYFLLQTVNEKHIHGHAFRILLCPHVPNHVGLPVLRALCVHYDTLRTKKSPQERAFELGRKLPEQLVVVVSG
ncbi:hypothetical protein LP419_08395 [Massilia sp. H-1]|nr:hypothetical protein LP419_08395 [Massilia sp. H-1]